jgi:hypothetical protein
MREDIKFEPFDQVKHEAGFQAIADEVDARVLERIVNMNLDAEYKKYVEHWGDPIDPINYKLYSIETDIPCFHPDNRLFTKEEFKDFSDSNQAFKEMWKLKQESIDAAELLYNIVKKEVDELNKEL